MRQLREAYLRKEPVDQDRVLVRREPLVEELRVLERVASRHAVRPREAPAGFRAHFARPEAEARSDRLVQDPREQHVRARVERLWLAIGGQDAVFVQSIPAALARRGQPLARVADHDVARFEARPREQVDRSVLAPQVAAAYFERAPRRELEALLRP